MQDVTFNQPDKKVHHYVSADPVGYEVTQNEDRRTWSAKFNDTTLDGAAKSRALAFDAVNAHANPQDAQVPAPDGEAAPGAVNGEEQAAASPAPAKPKVNGREHKFLSLLSAGDGPVSATDVGSQLELDYATVTGVLSNLARRQFVTLTPEGSAITDAGREAMATFIPKEPKPKKEKPAKDPNAVRKNSMEDRFGPRPADVGPRPTKLEFAEARLKNALASQEFAIIVRRVHPYSPLCVKKIDSANERVTMAQAEVDKLRDSTNGSADAPATDTPVTEEATG